MMGHAASDNPFHSFFRDCRVCGDRYETTLPDEVFQKAPEKDLCWPCSVRRIEAERDGHDHPSWSKCGPGCPRNIKEATDAPR